MNISRETLDMIRDRVRFPDLLHEHGFEVRRNGKLQVMLCPFHAERTPSFTVYDDHAHCFGCDWHGDVFKFVQERDGCTFPQAVEYLAAVASVPVAGHRGPPPAPRPRPIELRRTPDWTARVRAALAATKPEHLAQHPARPEAVSVEALTRLGAFCSRQHPRAIAFPMRAPDGRCTGNRLRFPNGDKLSVDGSRAGLFLPDGLDARDLLLICEGATDTCVALDMGFEAAGRPSCQGQHDLVVDLVRMHAPVRIAVIADAQPQEQEGAARLAELLRIYCADVCVVLPPDGFNDLRAWRIAGATGDELRARLDAAQPLPASRLQEERDGS